MRRLEGATIDAKSSSMKYLLLASALLLCACGAPQQTPAPPAHAPAQSAGIAVSGGWASPTPGGVAVSAGYMTITNNSDTADTLTGASSPRAASVEIHRMSMEGAVMQMRPAGPLPIPAHQSITLAPGGLHLMFQGVSTPFAEGESIPVQLIFEHAGSVSAELPVSRAAPAAHGMGDTH
jgi:hypothetical protein